MRAASVTALLALAACSQAQRTPAVEGAWVRLPAIAGRPGAAYFTLVGGVAPARLVAVESAAAAKVELHEGGMHAGMTTMRPIASVNLPPRAPTVFRPGGNHAMLFGIRPEVRPGGTMPLAFRFEDGARLMVEATVVAAGDSQP